MTLPSCLGPQRLTFLRWRSRTRGRARRCGDSDPFRSSIPIHSDHLFRFNPITPEEAMKQLACGAGHPTPSVERSHVRGGARVARPRVAMRKIKDVLRLSHGERLSRRQVSASLGIPLTTVNDHLVRARRAGLSWPLPDDMDDTALERALFPPTAPSNVARPLPDWGHVHKELKRKGVTLQLLWIEYRETHPEGLGYSQFFNVYRAWRKTTRRPFPRVGGRSRKTPRA